MKKTVLIIGAGPGLGLGIAKNFGRQNFRVVLVARNQSHLDDLIAKLQAEGIEAYSEKANVADKNSLQEAFGHIKSKFETVDVMIYNAGITAPANLNNTSRIDLESHFQVDVSGAYQCIQMAIDKQLNLGTKTIMMTGGDLGITPSADFLPLSMDKAALRSMAQALHQSLAEENIFVGLVTVSDLVKSGTHFDPEKVGQAYLQMYQSQTDWEITYK